MAKLAIRNAVIRGIRTSAQALAGGLISAPAVAAVSDMKRAGLAYFFALFGAVMAGIISFLQNVAEDNTAADIPK